MSVTLYGYHYSVYLRIVRLALAEKGLRYRQVEVDPFADEVPAAYLAMHPFGRVPTLEHDGFIVYETVAITRYLDEAFPAPALQPVGPRERARVAQIISVIDAYGYWPMVRQVFSHRVFAPRIGRAVDEREIEEGLAASSRALGALEALTEGDAFLVGGRLSLADLHLAPMVAYFALSPEGEAMLSEHPKLARWWRSMRRRPSVVQTDPRPPP